MVLSKVGWGFLSFEVRFLVTFFTNFKFTVVPYREIENIRVVDRKGLKCGLVRSSRTYIWGTFDGVAFKVILCHWVYLRFFRKYDMQSAASSKNCSRNLSGFS